MKNSGRFLQAVVLVPLGYRASEVASMRRRQGVRGLVMGRMLASQGERLLTTREETFKNLQLGPSEAVWCWGNRLHRSQVLRRVQAKQMVTF